MTGTRRCLVVDDAEDARMLICLGLDSAHFEVVAQAATAVAAMEAAHSSHPDVVLVDIMMPGTDGEATIAALRAILPDARIVACSALPAERAAASSLAAGADHYLEKRSLLDVGRVLVTLLSRGRLST